LAEALELFFEAADLSEVEARLHSEVLITRLEVVVGQSDSRGEERRSSLRP